MHDDVALFLPPTTESGFEGFTLPPAVCGHRLFYRHSPPTPRCSLCVVAVAEPPPPLSDHELTPPSRPSQLHDRAGHLLPHPGRKGVPKEVGVSVPGGNPPGVCGGAAPGPRGGLAKQGEGVGEGGSGARAGKRPLCACRTELRMSAVCVVPVSEYFALMCASLILFCPGYRCRSRLLLCAAVGYETPISQNVF